MSELNDFILFDLANIGMPKALIYTLLNDNPSSDWRGKNNNAKQYCVISIRFFCMDDISVLEWIILHSRGRTSQVPGYLCNSINEIIALFGALKSLIIVA